MVAPYNRPTTSGKVRDRRSTTKRAQENVLKDMEAAIVAYLPYE
jgi:hypothetical protein